jgi:hypothetical protein
VIVCAEEIPGSDSTSVCAPDGQCLGVCGIQSIGQIKRHDQEPFQVHRTASDSMFERLSVEKFHSDKRFAICFADFIDCADIRVI